MVIKILNAASADFNGVRYNDKKIEGEKAELMLKKNFPSNVGRSADEVRNYLKSISENKNVTKPQFHAVISSRFREQSKEELTAIAEGVMDKMGYGEQPYLVIFHNDTENNHVHIVSTRIDKKTGKKIPDNFERLKAQDALRKTVFEKFDVDNDQRLKSILKYNFTSKAQLVKAIKSAGYTAVSDEDNPNKLEIYRKGLIVHSINHLDKMFKSPDKERQKQIRAILKRYSGRWSGSVFSIEDRRHGLGLFRNPHNVKPKISLFSELQHKLKQDFGMEIVFHSNNEKQPFGYSLIDHSTGNIYKGSDLIKMNQIFSFSSEKIDRRLFERINDFKMVSAEEKEALLNHFSRKHKNLKINMILGLKGRATTEEKKTLRSEYFKILKGKPSTARIETVNGKQFLIDEKIHRIEAVENLLNREIAEKVENQLQNAHLNLSDLGKSTDSFIKEILKPTAPTSAKEDIRDEDPLKKRRKKRR